MGFGELTEWVIGKIKLTNHKKNKKFGSNPFGRRRIYPALAGMQIRLLANGLDPNFSFLLRFVNLIFPITHSVNSPKPSVPSFQHSNWGEAPKFENIVRNPVFLSVLSPNFLILETPVEQPSP